MGFTPRHGVKPDFLRLFTYKDCISIAVVHVLITNAVVNGVGSFVWRDTMEMLRKLFRRRFENLLNDP